MKIQTPASFCLSAGFGLVLCACATANGPPVSATPEKPAMTEPTTPAPAQNQIRATGIVRFQQINGGFWGIIADDGTRYDPMDLDPQFQKDGLRVRFEALPETEMMSSRMWGTMITLLRIEALGSD